MVVSDSGENDGGEQWWCWLAVVSDGGSGSDEWMVRDMRQKEAPMVLLTIGK